MTYTKKLSITETIEVSVDCPSHFGDFRRHSARMRRDNPKMCSCDSCCNPRNAGNGNSTRLVLHISEGRALIASVQDVAECELSINSKWRSRKYGTSTHFI
jgi:hypothetical protein